MACVNTPDGGMVLNEQEFSRTINTAFVTAVLLTADVAQAEAAVLEAIHLTDLEQRGSEALLKATVVAATGSQPSSRRSHETWNYRSSVLPWQLNSVTYLSTRLRQCFVLRVLRGWSRDCSASVLQLTPGAVDEYTLAAVVRLTYIQQVFSVNLRRNGRTHN